MKGIGLPSSTPSPHFSCPTKCIHLEEGRSAWEHLDKEKLNKLSLYIALYCLSPAMKGVVPTLPTTHPPPHPTSPTPTHPTRIPHFSCTSLLQNIVRDKDIIIVYGKPLWTKLLRLPQSVPISSKSTSILKPHIKLHTKLHTKHNQFKLNTKTPYQTQ